VVQQNVIVPASRSFGCCNTSSTEARTYLSMLQGFHTDRTPNALNIMTDEQIIDVLIAHAASLKRELPDTIVCHDDSKH
jgi:hypothetical protein